MKYRIALTAAALALTLTACGEPPDTHPGKPVTHRRQAFKEILRSFEPMGVQLRTDRYDQKSFLAHAEKLEQVKNGPWQYFGPDTNYPPTHAKPEVWSQAEKFEKDRKAFLSAVDNLLEVAKTGDQAKIKPVYSTLHDACKTCHDSFKNE